MKLIHNPGPGTICQINGSRQGENGLLKICDSIRLRNPYLTIDEIDRDVNRSKDSDDEDRETPKMGDETGRTLLTFSD